ncbi:purine catabolism regulator [Terracoccus luteus]|uniref:Purine catabolism regulator n=1 Tax=Terracoccus luteus TaxID=53356 RepID=A0A495Y220_9MICO|nr:PucR family transcriptional regulator ligand-binding domain-containing protein [Terracoccus luteus]RKT79026.1 purine catabolism regulator [Terracoccus luteus]
MPTTLRRLVADRRFHLTLVTAAPTPTAAPAPAPTGDRPDDTTGALDAPVTWAHSSDLPDPTPWLEPGQLLLTDGAQFETVLGVGRTDDTGVADVDPRFADDYIRRLVRADVLALGFAVDVVHAAVPPALVAACAAHGLPLLEVGGRTPFIAIVRHVAEVLATEARERLDWSLRAQRSLARAALRPDGLSAVLGELERQLGCWVALYDAAGHRVPVRTRRDVPASATPALDEAVHAVLARGVRAATRLGDLGGGSGGLDVTLQTLGSRGRLRGVLAVGAPVPLDPAAADLVTSVIALASIALEQSRALDAARRSLRSGLLELLLAGTPDVAAATARRVWGGFPTGGLRVLACAVEGPSADLVLDDLEITAADRRGRVFFAEQAGGPLLVLAGPTDVDDVSDVLVGRHGLRVGVSGAGNTEGLARLVSEAGRALERTTAPAPLAHFDTLHGEGLLGVLAGHGGTEVARRVLAPLLASPDSDELLRAVRAWCEHNCAWDPAARSLGIHRHTLRHRVGDAARLLGLDLDRFDDRVELWNALRLHDLAT